MYNFCCNEFTLYPAVAKYRLFLLGISLAVIFDFVFVVRPIVIRATRPE